MKNVFVVSVALALLFPVLRASAITVENVSVSDTGGVSVSSEANATGSADAEASAHSIITSEGSNTRVRVELRTNTNGVTEEVSVDETLAPGERMELRAGAPAATDTDLVAQETEEASSSSELSLGASAASGFSPLFERLSSFIGRLLDLIIFW